MDALGAFLAERCTLNATAATPLTDAASAFNAWAKELHVPFTRPQTLGPQLRARGFTVERKREGRIVEGLAAERGAATHDAPPHAEHPA